MVLDTALLTGYGQISVTWAPCEWEDRGPEEPSELSERHEMLVLEMKLEHKSQKKKKKFLLRQSAQNITLSIFKQTIQWHLVQSQCCATTASSHIFVTPKEAFSVDLCILGLSHTIHNLSGSASRFCCSFASRRASILHPFLGLKKNFTVHISHSLSVHLLVDV